MHGRLADVICADQSRAGDLQASDHGQDALDKVKDAFGNLTGKAK